jgi:hypothetical protein
VTIGLSSLSKSVWSARTEENDADCSRQPGAMAATVSSVAPNFVAPIRANQNHPGTDLASGDDRDRRDYDEADPDDEGRDYLDW